MTYTATSALHMALWEGGGEVEMTARVQFNVIPATKATEDEPASAADVDILSFLICKPNGEWILCPGWIRKAFEADDSFKGWLLDEAAERDGYAFEQNVDADREERNLERLP